MYTVLYDGHLILLNQAPAGCRPAPPGFSGDVCMCVCVFVYVCVSAPEAINN